jgi:rubredoxin
MHCPLSSQVENGSWAGKAYFKNLKFFDFAPAKNAEGVSLKNTMIKLLPKSPDFITLQHFDNMQFDNCDSDLITEFFDPPQKWANLADCGDYPCTGPKNTIFSFVNTKWTNPVGSLDKEDFTLIPHIATYTD